VRLTNQLINVLITWWASVGLLVKWDALLIVARYTSCGNTCGNTFSRPRDSVPYQWLEWLSPGLRCWCQPSVVNVWNRATWSVFWPDLDELGYLHSSSDWCSWCTLTVERLLQMHRRLDRARTSSQYNTHVKFGQMRAEGFIFAAMLVIMLSSIDESYHKPE